MFSSAVGTIRPLFCLFMTSLSSGCLALRLNPDDASLRHHAVFVEQNGSALRMPVKGQSEAEPWRDESMSGEEYNRYLNEMMTSIRSHPNRKIMVVVHGGLARLRGTKNENLELADSIWRAGYYPVFINWRSALRTSYFEHLFLVRQGKRDILLSWHTAGGVLSSPFYLAADVGRGITRAPITAYHQLSNSVVGTLPKKYGEYEALRSNEGDSTQIKVSLGEFRTKPEKLLLAPVSVAWFPARVGISSLVDMAGTSAWENMLRRTQTMFQRPADFSSRTVTGASHLRDRGAAAVLMDSLSNLILTDAAPREVVLVGHSMGTIVLNEIIRRHPNVPFKHIVYMGAACSIRDLQQSVVPYLERHPKANFYNLSLHPQAEAREKNAWVGPTGSLLEMIDDYLARPATHLDRTAGKWENIIEATGIFPASVRGRVHLKAFGVNDPSMPEHLRKAHKPSKHGDFNDPDVRFWEEEFWKP